MTDLDARADRVRAIALGNHGRVIGRNGDIMEIELPADVAISLNRLWGEGGFLAIVKGEHAPRTSPRDRHDGQCRHM